MLLNVRFGDYVLLRKIAKGGMAEVYLAAKKGPGNFDKIVALKTIIPQRQADHSFNQMFFNEARLTARFSHPNVIAVYDLVVINGRPTIAMEYVPGSTVADLVKKAAEKGEPFVRPVALTIAMESCRGLYHAHHLTDYDGSPLSLVHRDVSPQNILVGYAGQVKVFDFGIARITDNPNDENLAGVLAGKYAYMSPEQTQGGDLDERSDVFSLGIILYELTTQQRLFKRSNQIEVLRAITEEDISPPSTIVPGYPRDLERIVMSALARDPSFRPRTALELRDALAAYTGASGETLSMEALGAFTSRVFSEEVRVEQAFLKEASEYLKKVDLTEVADLVEPPEFSSPESGPDTEPVPRPEPERVDKVAELKSMAARTVSAIAERQAPSQTVSSLFPSVREDLYRDLKRSRRSNVALTVGLLVVIAASLALFLTSVIRDGGDGGGLSAGNNQGQLRIATEPPGAVIFIDGVQRAEQTPATIRVPLGRPLNIETRLDGWETASMTVSADDPQVVQSFQLFLRPAVQLTDQRGAIRVVTSPAEAAVFVDGTYYGLSPAIIENLVVGVPHTLRVQNIGFETHQVEFTLDSTRTREFQLVLTERLDLGMMSVLTQPEGAILTIDGEQVGTTPIVRFPLVAARDYVIELELMGYRSYRTTVRIEAAQEVEVNQRLVRLRDRSPGRTDDSLDPSTSTPAEPSAPGEGAPPGITPLQDEQPPQDDDPYDLI